MEHEEAPSRSSISMEQESASRLATAVIKPDILLKEIMMRLPARLLRFRLVDKRWRRISSGPNFRKRHTRHQAIKFTSETGFIITTQSRHLYLNPTTRALVPFSFTLSPLTKILQCSYGLMLLECRDSWNGPKYYCVANPITRRARKLSIQTDPLKIEKIDPFFLSYDPSESDYYKVGFMRVASEYRILDVYDSESREWQQRSFPDANHHLPYYLHANTERRICLDNLVFSVSLHGAILYLNTEQKKLNFGTIWNPSILYDRNYVLEWEGSLCCISIHSHFMLVHLMDESKGWSLIDKVDLNWVHSTWPKMKGHIAVMGMVRGERDVSILFHGAGKIVAYRVFNECFELLFDLRPQGRHPLYLLGAHQFNHTLALV